MQFQKLLIVVFLLVFFHRSTAQEQRALTVGDKLPGYIFKNLVGLSLKKHEDAKSKIFILDLWSIYCHSCIAGIRKLDSLQRSFADQVQIILITKSTEKEIVNLFSRIKFNQPDLPMLFSDTLFYDKMFPHDGDPLNVWLDSSGTILYITYGYNTTRENLQKVIAGNLLNVSQVSKLENFNAAKPLITNYPESLKDYIQQYSFFTKGIYGYVSSNRIEFLRDTATQKPYSIKAINASILTLYQIAFNNQLYGFDLNMFSLRKNSRVILESPKARLLDFSNSQRSLDEWKKENLFCYEIVNTSNKSMGIYKTMQDDLKRYFDFNATTQKRRTNCLVLLQNRNRKKKTKSHNENSSIEGVKMRSLIEHLIYITQDFNLPIVDESGIDRIPNIALPSSAPNLDILNAQLQKLGLVLKKKKRKIDVLVVK